MQAAIVGVITSVRTLLLLLSLTGNNNVTIFILLRYTGYLSPPPGATPRHLPTATLLLLHIMSLWSLVISKTTYDQRSRNKDMSISQNGMSDVFLSVSVPYISFGYSRVFEACCRCNKSIIWNSVFPT